MMSHVFSLVIELAISAGCPQPLHSHPGAWEFTFTHDGQSWRVFINGHDTPQRVSAMEVEDLFGGSLIHVCPTDGEGAVTEARNGKRRE